MRTHLARGCRECLDEVFGRPIGAPRPEAPAPAVHRLEDQTPGPPESPARLLSAPALVLAGVALAVAALAAFSLLSSQPGQATLREPRDFAGRLATLEAVQAALTSRLLRLSPAFAGAEAEVSRQVAAARAQAARSAHLQRELAAAEARIVRLNEMVRRRHADLRREVVAARAQAARVESLTVFAGGVPPSGCSGLSDEAGRVCRTFCLSRGCTTHPDAECDRLRARFETLTGASSPRCTTTATSVTEDLTPCDRDHVDLWTFPTRRDQEYHVSVDTSDGSTAADFCVIGVCDGGDTFFGDDQVPCSSPAGRFACPRATFVASSDQSCTAAVAICSEPCMDPRTARYRLTVDPADALRLVADDILDADGGAAVTARR